MKKLIINDIFPPVDIQDNSIYIFFLLLFAVILSIGFITRFIYKKFRGHKESRKDKYIKILKNCDFKNAKQSSYKISYYAPLIAQTDKEKKAMHDIVTKLSLYKYKKDVPEIPQEIKEQLYIFLNTIEYKHV